LLTITLWRRSLRPGELRAYGSFDVARVSPRGAAMRHARSAANSRRAVATPTDTPGGTNPPAPLGAEEAKGRNEVKLMGGCWRCVGARDGLLDARAQQRLRAEIQSTNRTRADDKRLSSTKVRKVVGRRRGRRLLLTGARTNFDDYCRRESASHIRRSKIGRAQAIHRQTAANLHANSIRSAVTGTPCGNFTFSNTRLG